MNWYLLAIKKYTDFEGRATRQAYWMFFLINIIAVIVAAMLDQALGTTYDYTEDGSFGYGVIYTLYSLFILLPGVAIMVRRLHDVNKSGWFCFVSFIPLIGLIWLLVLLARRGDASTNQYGEMPKDDEEDTPSEAA